VPNKHKDIDRPHCVTNVTIDNKDYRDKLNISCQNVRSACNKTAAICESISSSRTDILVITETWHEPGNTAILRGVTPPGYECVDRPRPIPPGIQTSSSTFQNYGGIAIIYKSSMSVQPFSPPISVSSFEYLCCRFRRGASLIILVAIYRPGSKSPSVHFRHNGFYAIVSATLVNIILAFKICFLSGM